MPLAIILALKVEGRMCNWTLPKKRQELVTKVKKAVFNHQEQGAVLASLDYICTYGKHYKG